MTMLMHAHASLWPYTTSTNRVQNLFGKMLQSSTSGVSELCLEVSRFPTSYSKSLVSCFSRKAKIDPSYQVTCLGEEWSAIQNSNNVWTQDIALHVPNIQLNVINPAVDCLEGHDYHQAVTILDQWCVAKKVDSFSIDMQCAVLFGYGLAYYKMEDYNKAEIKLQSLTNMCKTHSSLRGILSLAYVYLGDVSSSLYKYEQAAHCYGQAVLFYGKKGIENIFKLKPVSIARLYIKQATALKRASQILPAIDAFRRAISIAMDQKEKLEAHTSLGNILQSLGDHQGAIDEYNMAINLAEQLQDYVTLGWNQGNLGNAYVGKGNGARGIFHLKQALELAFEYERTSQAIGKAYNNIGTAYQLLNQLEEAEKYYVLALDQAVYGNDTPGEARAHGNLGNISMLRKNYDKAYENYTKVLLVSTDKALRNTAFANRGQCLYEKAKSTEEISMFNSEQIQVLYQDAIQDLREVVRFHEESFQTIKQNPAGLKLSASLFEIHSSPSRHLIDCLFNLGRHKEALVVAEASRSRIMSEIMLRKEPLNLITPLSYEDMCSVVLSGNCTILYVSYTGNHIIIWGLILGDGCLSMKVSRVPIPKEIFDNKSLATYLNYSLPEEVANFHYELFRKCDYTIHSLFHKLFEVLGKPIKDMLKTTASTAAGPQNVILIPDSHTIFPIASLCDPACTEFLGDHHCFRIMPSLLTMGMINHSFNSTNVSNTHPMMSIDIDPQDSDSFCIIGDPNIPPFTLDGEYCSLGRLPHAALEATSVAYILHGRAIVGDSATKSAVLGKLKRAKLVHIATHGSPVSGYLAFANPHAHSTNGEVTSKEVLLLPSELEQMSIGPALVVLSCCNSARGKVSADGMLSMARAFLLAGAQSILTTLWEVPDESAGVFMQFFYQYLMDGLSSTLALHKATLSLRCFKKFAQYIHWGGYQLIGADVKLITHDQQEAGLELMKEISFPLVELMMKLETALVIRATNIHEPTSVQVISGSGELNPSQCALDFILQHHLHFKIIIYISKLLQANDSVEEATCGTGESGRVLLVLDDIELVKLPMHVLKLARLPTTSIIIICSSPLVTIDSISQAIGTVLLRGCNLHSLTPLSLVHCTQRIVYSVISRTNLIPLNKEQEVIVLLSDLTCGSPIVVDVVSELVCYYCQYCNDPMDQLFAEVINPALLKTATNGDSILSFLQILIEAWKLDRVEYLSLCSVCLLQSIPFPHSILLRIVDIIICGLPQCRWNSNQLISGLLKKALLRVYPQVMIKPCYDNRELYLVPNLISEAMLQYMDPAEAVLAATTVHTAIRDELGRSPQCQPFSQSPLSFAALNRSLAMSLEQLGLVNKDVYVELWRPVAHDLTCNVIC